MLRVLVDEQGLEWHGRLMMGEMAEPTEACFKLVEAYIRPIAETLHGILHDLLPAGSTDQERWLIGSSIMGQCLFYKINRPVVQLLMGAAAFGRLNVKILAGHLSHFSLPAIAARESPPSRPRRKEASR